MADKQEFHKRNNQSCDDVTETPRRSTYAHRVDPDPSARPIPAASVLAERRGLRYQTYLRMPLHAALEGEDRRLVGYAYDWISSAMTAPRSLDQRFYKSPFGRFMSADRSRQAAKANDSGSWNKYSYVQNDLPGYATGRHLNGALGSAIPLNKDFFLNNNTNYQSNVLLHELLHVYLKSNSDEEVYSLFANAGLKHTTSVYPNSEDISAWLSTDCKSTPTSMTWWNN